MHSYINQLNAYFSQIQLGEGCETTDRALEFLWEQYNSMFPHQDAQVTEAEHRMRDIYDALPNKEADKLFFLVSDLCIAYERAAFLNGIRLGAKLTSELCGNAPLL